MNITVSWTPPSPLNYTSGYRVNYKVDHSTSWQSIIIINDAIITTVNVTGLTSGIYYNVSIVGISEHLPSEMRHGDIYLGYTSHTIISAIIVMVPINLTAVPPPQKPLVSVSNRGTTTLTLSMESLPEENYQVCVFWEKIYPLCLHNNRSNCSIVTNTFSEYLISGLDEGSSYSITVMVTNAAGKAISDPLNTLTLETGMSF